MSKRRRLFWICFLGGAAAFALGPQYFEPRDPVVEPVVRKGPLAELRSADADRQASGRRLRPDEAPTAQAVRLADAARVAAAARAAPPATDLFAARNWQLAAAPVAPRPVRVGPPPPPTVAVQQAPTAPPMPFRFIGKLAEGDRLQVFLLKGGQLHVVQVGDLIDEQYRVDSITGTQMELTFLPSNAAQTLTIGTAL